MWVRPATPPKAPERAMTEFIGSELRLARIFNAYSLDEVAEKVGKTRQYVHKCEVGLARPTPELTADFASVLRVRPSFFFKAAPGIAEEQFHFRKLFTTKAMVKQVAMARGEMFVRLVAQLDRDLRLPTVKLPEFGSVSTPLDVEEAAENCRREWDLGMGPIDDLNRLAENLGVLITSFNALSTQVDALSVATARPIIVRNEAKESVCRQRFDIGHELGHLVMHTGVVTGDKATENQANRFASALLIPRAMMMKLFPRPRSGRLDWHGIREFKRTWKVSKAAILYRAHQLELLTDDQYKTGAITLRRTGEATGERDDSLIPKEGPELLNRSLNMLASRKQLYGPDLAERLDVDVAFLDELVGFETPRRQEPRRPHLSLVS
jgi:Zn-dependent peptidase ImmA (M78 family)/transcriptional regulator with XRE-family HTH domain